ncbi:MAG: hypothetical protein AB7Q97_11940 [Gammaproteobacteria bacterium]
MMLPPDSMLVKNRVPLKNPPLPTPLIVPAPVSIVMSAACALPAEQSPDTSAETSNIRVRAGVSGCVVIVLVSIARTLSYVSWISMPQKKVNPIDRQITARR